MSRRGINIRDVFAILRDVFALVAIFVLAQYLALWWWDGERAVTVQVSRPEAATTWTLPESAAAGAQAPYPASSSSTHTHHPGFHPTHPWLP